MAAPLAPAIPDQDASEDPEADARARALRAFARRDWASAARAKELWWRDWKREHGPAAGVRIGDELRRQAIAARPGWPSERERAEDLATHLRLIEVIRRVPRSR